MVTDSEADALLNKAASLVDAYRTLYVARDVSAALLAATQRLQIRTSAGPKAPPRPALKIVVVPQAVPGWFLFSNDNKEQGQA